MPARQLPNFRSPPVNQVVLSIQFAHLAAVTCAHFGVFWTRIRDRYPKVTEHAPLDPSFEVFGGPSFQPMVPQVRINAALKPPAPRFVFESSTGQELLQVQQDRIMHNWRRKLDEDEYPRYEHVRERLQADFDAFSAFLSDEKLGEMKPNQCEVTYVNVITLETGANPHSEIARITTFANPWPAGEDLPVLENTIVQAKTIFQREGEPTCRLYLQLQPVVLMGSGAPAIQLELTARGKPTGDSFHDSLALLDFGREGIVRTFAALTTREMHKVWGRVDVN